ncbi:hypothetical protein BRYFOR_05374 [Marvinbryantia formatexigens DSM 14469]|uniref:GNAT family acetyltransferase n=1 Tax=Marvinbryantia formatexigens DSM 14469 TaxID=478749 RepID=C6L9T4_9FIRM|nr:hypothetical protein [Marvinbryantia formatexigens]EET62341.1 hypothetical protein BRYFOR_05374 [Marvinbryantia formatexigens DSM 14469]UWO25102.1 GNAT family acetyltransferase [Marvinbryantia formatexigens DSM 14469]SDG95552.1 hypothetical protein SAMN05660368_03587 [Marvinbryantia formatexigens]
MAEYRIANILDMADVIGEKNLKVLLSGFFCPRNKELQHFVRENAYDFARKKISVTYLIIDEDNLIAAVFALAHKAIEISNEGLSGAKRRKINRYAVLDASSDSYTVSAFLIAQLGKNYAPGMENSITGNALIDAAFEILVKVRHDIGGGIVFLECEDKPGLLRFYQDGQNGFMPFSERYAAPDKIKYIQLFQFF